MLNEKSPDFNYVGFIDSTPASPEPAEEKLVEEIKAKLNKPETIKPQSNGESVKQRALKKDDTR